MKYQLICPSNRPEYFDDLQESLPFLDIKFYPGYQFDSFASLLNSAADATDAEILIFVNDKARPSLEHVAKILQLLESGFGLVGLYRFGFFGISKCLFEQLGGFDEGFSDGGFEDNDFLIRLKMSNIAVYLSEEIPYASGIKSSWQQIQSRKYFFQKYKFHIFSKVIFSKEKANFINPGNYLSWSESSICAVPLVTYKANFGMFLRICRVESMNLAPFIKFKIIIFSLIRNISSLFLIKPRSWKYYS